MQELTLTDESFNTLTRHCEGILIVDFWAQWCGPCKAMYPMLQSVAEERKLTLAKVNVDEEVTLATRYAIVSIPTLQFYKNGKLWRTVNGSMDKVRLMGLLDDLERQDL